MPCRQGKLCDGIRGVSQSRGYAADVDVRPGRELVYAFGAFNIHSSSIGFIERNQRTGRLRQFAGQRGCLNWSGGSGCAHAAELVEAKNVTVVHGGRLIYALVDHKIDLNSGQGELAVFTRDQDTGAVRRLPPGQACRTARGGSNCVASNIEIVAGNVYAVTDVVRTYARNRRTGVLRELAPEVGCFGGPGPLGLARNAGCRLATGMPLNAEDGAFGFVSPEGRSLYIASARGIAVFRRDARTGRLTQLPGAAGCVDDRARASCGKARVGYPYIEAISPGRGRLYASSDDRLTIFARNRRTGAIRELPGRRGCVALVKRRDCLQIRGIGPFIGGMTMSPYGHNIYLSSLGKYRPGGTVGQGVAVLKRVRSGGLRQLQGPDGCVTAQPKRRCRHFPELRHMTGPASAIPDGSEVLVGTPGGILRFRRQGHNAP